MLANYYELGFIRLWYDFEVIRSDSVLVIVFVHAQDVLGTVHYLCVDVSRFSHIIVKPLLDDITKMSKVCGC